ncbi:MAG: tRNA (adenosine(37)-N6)-threonylcarbamoyltransferase complex transferase subunit TsaD [Clostridiales Family XIII bacterium]|jgi:N6-L-threonylcarbamoyladenine synthase|nr:tRNA (adenosine(37)-N6)-threonylcarbamoyltransferase complex transferase subunit TsaD [Clostridiales Family XIII bacterium]
MKDGKFITLGIETSCDETAAAVTADGRETLSNVIASQIDVHKVFGGVVPEIASRHHLTQINAVMDSALSEAGVSWEDIDLVGATYGPGLVGAVLIGLSTAKAAAYAAAKPFAAVHHIKGHVCASYLSTASPGVPARGLADADAVDLASAGRSLPEDEGGAAVAAMPTIEPPHLALVVSGGHTDLIDVRSYTDYVLLGHTRDDAVGEAFDKVARSLGLGYPGGPKVDELAKNGDPTAVKFKRVYLEEGSLDFSFSGIKTGVLNYINTERQAGREVNLADVAAGFEASATDVIETKTRLALRRAGRKKLTMGGGVAANSMLRSRIAAVCMEERVELYAPPPVYCTDNAAMIACAAYYQYLCEGSSSLDIDAYASLPL